MRGKVGRQMLIASMNLRKEIIDNSDLPAGRKQKARQMCSDETSAAGDKCRQKLTSLQRIRLSHIIM